MTEYDSGAFESVGYDTNDFCALLVTISIEEPNQLNLTIGFDNLGFVDTSLVLYVFNNDTNEMLYTNTVVISGTENTLSLAMDRSVTAARITLAVPYLWQITWVGADSYINKSAIVNLAANTTISAKINIIDGYNNIIII